MNLLLDTHVLLWAAAMPQRLSPEACEMLENSANILHFSAASLWEVAIKASLGRADFDIDARLLRRGLLDNGYFELPVTSSHAVAVLSLPPLNKHPLDRLLLAQAISEGFVLLTADTQLMRYPGPLRQV